MKEAFIQGFNKTIYTMGFIYGYIKKGLEMKLGMSMFSKHNVEFAYGVFRDEFELYFN